jgi:uncharacterized membrane protein YhiD involved in acid resistance
VAVGAGDYVLAVGGAGLVVGTLFGLRRASAMLQRWGVSREEFVIATRPGFDVERIVDVVRRERVELRGLDREAGGHEDRIVLVVKLRPRYRPDQLLDVLGRLDGVRQVEWEH